MKKYALYSQDVSSTERETLLARFPQAAQYLPFYLFPQTHEQLIGAPAASLIDLSQYSLIDNVEDRVNENQMTYAEFDAYTNDLLAQEHTGREVILSVHQGRYLRDTRYA